MKKYWLLVVILVSVAVASQAQSRRQSTVDYRSPSVELYGGYSYLSIDGQGVVKRQNGHGWGASVSGNLHPNIGVVADFGGHYGHVDLPGIGSSVSAGIDYQIHEALIGPRFFKRFDQATPFFHVLFGVVDTRIPHGPVVRGSSNIPFLSGISSTDFAMAIGGGVDYNLSPSVALRLFQLDYIPVRVEPTRHDIRGTVGLVLKLGK